MSHLSLDAADVARQLWQNRALVLSAEPGAGKSTLVPLALARAPHRPSGQIWVIQPRRIAARLCATYVAKQCHEPVGKHVGYRVRDDDATSVGTQIIYMTEGIFWRALLAAPCAAHALRYVAAIIFDEFHGRTLASDVGLGVVNHLRLQAQQADSRSPAILVMSATLDVLPVAALLGGAATVVVGGRQHPVTTEYLQHKSSETQPVLIARAVGQMLGRMAAGELPKRDILVFLPGVGEIVAAAKACAQLAQRYDFDVLTLHAKLSATEQDQAIKPSLRQRVVLSTNVAETSLTLPNVGVVIDSTWAKRTMQQEASGLTTLVQHPISNAAMEQRSGRAGRVAPGHCLRLITLAEQRQRAAFDVPEIECLPLAEVALWLAYLGLPTIDKLKLVTQAPRAAAQQAASLLSRLGSLKEGLVTDRGRRLVHLAVEPRLGAFLLAAQQRGILSLACRAAIVLSNPPPRPPKVDLVGLCDLWSLCDPVHFSGEQQRDASRLCRSLPNITQPVCCRADEEQALAESLLYGFSDRLARRLGPKGTIIGELPLAAAHLGRARLHAHSVVRKSALMLVLAATPGKTLAAGWVVTLACAVEADWLFALDDGRLSDEDILNYNEDTGKIERHQRIIYDGIVVWEQRGPLTDESRRDAFLRERRAKLPLEDFIEADELDMCLARLMLVVAHQPKFLSASAQTQMDGGHAHNISEAQWARAQLEQGVRTALDAGIQGVGGQERFKMSEVLRMLDPKIQLALHMLVPTNITLAGGKSLTVTYSLQHPPQVQSLLQNFFGSAVGPTILSGTHLLTLVLCGPNRRAVQVTRDLQGFWTRHYPKLRPALARRYPRHHWPEDPLQAVPNVFIGPKKERRQR